MAESKYSRKFNAIFNLTRNIATFCGADVIKNDYEVCWRTAAVFMVINLAIGFTFYTNYIEVIIKGNHNNLLKSASILGTAIQGYAKLINVLQQQNNFRFLHKEIMELYETYELKSSAYRKCLKHNISLVKKLLAATLTTMILTSLMIIGIPLFMLVFLNRRVQIMPFHLPVIDYESDFGFYLTFNIHVTCVLLGGFGNFAIDSWLFIYAANMPLMKSILKCKFDDLDVFLEADPKNVEKSHGPLRDILAWHQKYIVFCDTLKNTFFWVIFVQVGTEFFGMICTIVCMFLGIWPPAPSYLIYLLTLVYSYCALGNLVAASNDDVIVMIYNSRWYNLTVQEQKMILTMLGEAQQASGISIGGVAPLSLNTALQLTKAIYTFSMMLKEFLN